MSLTLADTKTLLNAAEQFALDAGLKLTIVVLDTGGHLLGLYRMDGAYLSTHKVADAKAYTAVNFGQSTGVLAERFPAPSQAALGVIDHRLTFLKGGLPIQKEGKVVGAIGVSGATADQDEQCAQFALQTLG